MLLLKNKIYFLVLFFLVLGVDSVNGQSYYFKNFQVEDGLSYHTVYCSIQDKKGFLWFGTRDGLNRYDGYQFKTFRDDPTVENSLGNNLIVSLYEDSKEKLWVGTTNGLYYYIENEESFQLIKGTSKRRVSSIREDKKNNLWFISDSTLYRYANNKLYKYNERKILEPTSIAIQANGDIWVATNKGFLNKYNEQTDSFIPFDLFENSNTTFKRIEVIYDTGQESILIGTSHLGIRIFDTKTYTCSAIIERNTDNTRIFVRDFVKNTEHEFWCATESGIYIYNTQTKNITNIKKKDNDPYALSDNSVYTLTKDKEGGIWIGTYFGGINYYPHQYNLFKKYYPNSEKTSLNGNIVRDICQDKNGMVWIGTEDAGLNKLDPTTGQFTHFFPTNSNTSIAYTNIHGLLTDDDMLWIGTFEHGLDILNINTGKVTKHYNAGIGKHDLKSNFITTLYETSTGIKLIGTSLGLYQYDPEIDAFHPINYVPGSSFVYSVYEDHRGTIWVGTIGDGVFYYNAKTKENGTILHSPDNKNGLNSNIIYSIFEDSEHNLWFNTDNNGLYVLKENRETFLNYTTQNGLPSNHTYKVLEDDNRNIWISTFAGLSSLSQKTGKIVTYTKANGLLTNQFNYGSGFKDESGDIYFGSVKGLIKFDPEGFIEKIYTPPIYITGFQVYNKEITFAKNNDILKKSIINADKIVLKHNESSFSLDFAALSFSTPENTSYSYILEGLEKTWTHIKTNRKVYFTKLVPGTYLFKVTSNLNGMPNPNYASIQIIVLPPWWASLWAYLFYSITGILLIFYSIKFFHQRLKESHNRKLEFLENKKEKDIYEAKIEFFTNIAHEIRTPLTLIKGPLEIITGSQDIEEIKENVATMDKNTNRLLSLANQLLDFRKVEIKAYNLNFIKTNISHVLKENFSRFRQAADLKKVEFSLTTPEDQIFASIDVEALTKIISNLLNNAIKYAKKDVHISLNTDESGDFFLIEIKNDGSIITEKFKEKIFEPFFRMNNDENTTGTGIGLTLARSLADLHKGFLTLEPSINDKNIFLLKLPVNQEFGYKFSTEELDYIEDEEGVDEFEKSPTKQTLLIIDDNKEIVQFIIKVLGKAYNYLTALNGVEAIEKLKKNRIDLIISDIMMPLMDGYTLCKKVKTDFNYSHIPLILLTAKDTMKSKIEGLESGADAYIEKPFSPEYLQVQITNLISNRNKIKEFFASSPSASIKIIANSQTDENFLEKLNLIIQRNLDDSLFSIDLLAEEMNMSRATLFRKIKAISNLTPNELINITRIKRAAELFSQEQYKIYEVSNMVGFSSPTVFSRIFQRQFGLSPTEFLNDKWGK